VFTKTGIYISLKNEFGVSFDLLESVKYTNSNLDELSFQSIVYTFIPKPDIGVFNEIIEMFKYIFDKSKWELCVSVYYDIKHKKFKLDIHDQIVSEVIAKYNYNENLEMSKNYIRYLQIHSHNSMVANFSEGDNKDENYSALCYYGVIGKISQNTKFYNADMKFRIWSGIRFIEVNLEDVFNIGPVTKELSKEQIGKLNMIIELSKKKTTEKSLPVKLDDPELNNFFLNNSLGDIVNDQHRLFY